jgi:hypothetical protein
MTAISPYPLPLGPGSYLGQDMSGRTTATPRAGTKSSIKGSSNFLSYERSELPAPVGPGD